MAELSSAEDVLSRQLEDADFRAEWERSALARAVALRIVAYRAEHGLSQTELGRRVGMSQPAVARLETGEHVPTIHTLLRLSDALRIAFLVDIGPADGGHNWISSSIESAEVIESVTTERGSRLLVAVS